MRAKIAGMTRKMTYNGTTCVHSIRRAKGVLVVNIAAARKKMATAMPAPVASSVVISRATTNISPYRARPMMAKTTMLFFITYSLL